ncbi:FAD-dependent oxidoreductase domain-containing protein 1 isoform X2 [Salarias fasciatus]|uniref:FAD-dependent oxidoreductase domain-containing protein 1 n=1 Tax=Salarias fasciatus TaxID=181472 RepID=A0A672FIH7_SALFA|nr:FAD-dependent oxidoreductase domain-containing protein 1 isoform X2 [Salarias fasciatus]
MSARGVSACSSCGASLTVRFFSAPAAPADMWRSLQPKLRPAARSPAAPPGGRRGLSTGTPLRSGFFKDLEAQLSSMRRKAVEALPGSGWSPLPVDSALPPENTDIVVVGGGVVGWSVAYWLRKKSRVRVLVVERDLTYSRASTVLSAGGIRQQFSLPENIHLSLASAHFLKDINSHLGVLDQDPVDLQFNQGGYLFLANEKQAPVMEENYTAQRAAGAQVCLLSAAQLKQRFPWISTEGVALASYGLENEGWFDPWTLLSAFRRKALSMGVQQCSGEVTGFNYSINAWTSEDGEPIRVRRIRSVQVQMPSSLQKQPVECTLVVNAAGAFSARLLEMLGVGAGMEGVPLPVEPRKRFVFVVHCPDGPGLDSPFLIDQSGVYFRREGLGGSYIAGASPEEADEPDVRDLEVDHRFFEDRVWPGLAARVPAFEKLKVTSSWAGFYDYNTLDQNGIVGLHPLAANMYLATGFSGHGLQQAPAVGRAVAELVLDGGFRTLDLRRFGFTRILQQKPLMERNIV